MIDVRRVAPAARGLVLAALVAAAGSSSGQADVALLLFGGDDHKTFLGCLNCGQYQSGSVCNKYGQHGSRYNSESIWNTYGTFGSAYSGQSPWSRYATDPPAIVDREGKFYGYLTANQYNPQRTRIGLYVQLTDLADEVQSDPDSVADRLCGR